MTVESAFTPLEKQQTVPEAIAAEILSLLRHKHLSAGDKLPPERELAEMLGVSRPSLREALRALSIMKVVEVRQGDGTYVSELKPEELVDHLEFVFMLDDSNLMQLFEARKIVESGNVRLAAVRISDEELSALRACLEESERSVEDAEAFMAADIELHRIICEAARNPVLGRFMASISALSRASRQKTTQVRAVREMALEHHREIAAALEAHDPAAAGEAMQRHLEHVEQMYRELAPVDPAAGQG